MRMMKSLLWLVCGLFSWQLLALEPDLRAQRPNFLFLVSEDNNPYLGCYGNTLVRTPHLDQLAARGLRFTQAHSPAPVCAPTRSSLITGRQATSLGTQHMRCQVQTPAGMRFYPSWLRAAGYFCTNNAKTDYNLDTPEGTWDENGNKAHWKNRPSGKPFFAVFNFGVTHESRLHAREALVCDPKAVRVPSYLPDTPEIRADIAQYHDRMGLLDQQVGEKLEELSKAGLADDTIIFYFADNGGVLPRSKRFLYHAGTHVPLLLHIPDKWRHLLAPQAASVIDDPVSLLDLPPTLLSLAGIPIPAHFDGRALVGPQTRAPRTYVHAFRDRMDECYDLSRAVIGSRFRYIRNYHPELPAGQHLDYLWRLSSMREWQRLHEAGRLNRIQSAFFEPRPAEELYDSIADPDNCYNLAESPGHQALLREMRAANRAHLVASRDLGFLPEPQLRELTRMTDAAILGGDEERYPLESILALLDQLQLEKQDHKEAQAAALRHAHPLIRYWGLVVSLRSSSLDPAVVSLLGSQEPYLRLTAAQCVLRHQDNPQAWDIVADCLSETQVPELRLMALQVLSQLPAFPKTVTAQLHRIPEPTDQVFGNYLHRMAVRLLQRVPADQD